MPWLPMALCPINAISCVRISLLIPWQSAYFVLPIILSLKAKLTGGRLPLRQIQVAILPIKAAIVPAALVEALAEVVLLVEALDLDPAHLPMVTMFR